MSVLSQGAKLADSPKLGFIFDFLIYRLIHMHASFLLRFSGTVEVYLVQQARLRGANVVATPKIS